MSVEATMRALACGPRRDILSRIAEQPDLSASDLSREMPISRQAISRHLHILAASGVITRGRSTIDGRDAVYVVNPNPLIKASEWMLELRRANPAETS